MKNKINLPGFIKEKKINELNASYFTDAIQGFSENSSVILPQYRSQVRSHCGPCINHKRQCISAGWECTVTGGDSGSEHLGIPGGPGHLRCVPEVFREWESRC